jgi:dCTP deaminase
MIINGLDLINAWPLEPMMREKRKEHGVSYGLSEAGYDVRIAQEVTLSGRNRFALASTVERFHMPENMIGIVHDKSTWARQGLSVFNTVIEPGWEGWLTLELVYHGSGSLIIPQGAGIAQVIFHEVSRPVRYDGKYQGQPDRPVEAILEREE